MNQRAYRLVFDRRRGMRVAAAEHVRSTGKAAGGGTRACAAVLGAAALLIPPAGVAQQRPPVVFASKLPAPAKPLPQPYGATTGRTDRTFVANPQLAPRVNWSVQGNTGTFDQGTVDRVVLNWDSFDIGAGYKVHFKQNTDPSRYVSALNKIWSADPSVILGSLTADREVILLNSNGVYFGRGARVDTGKFVATSLGIADTVFEKGLRNVTDGSAVFTTAGTDYQPTNLSSAVSVEAGAEIRSAAGGDVLLIAPRVVNQGRIETPKGQAVLAAGDKVYLMSSSDPKQRGLIVAVDPVKTAGSNVNDAELGIVENAATGSYKAVDGATVADSTPDGTAGLVNKINEIRADSGTVNLVGLTVRQNGNLRATTAVRGANGAIYLQAQESVTTLGAEAARARGLTIDADGQVTVASRLGTVVMGSGSRTEVLPSNDDRQTQLDAEVFNRSILRVEGKAIHVESGATLKAPSGRIDLLAAADAQSSTLFNQNAGVQAAGDGSRVVIDAGATIDAAGLRDVQLDGSRNQGELRLFRIELADSPVQRDGVLYRGAVKFNVRDANSITMANVTGAANAIRRSARELSTEGGALRIESEGAVVVGDNARLDISGGSVSYSPTTIKTSLLSRNGRVVTFDLADKNLRYDALLAAEQSRLVPSYRDGKDGGSLSVVGRQGYFGAAIKADVVQGLYQRGAKDRALPATATFGRQDGAIQYLQAIRLGTGSGTALGSGFYSNALEASLDGLPSSLDLSLRSLQASGLGRLNLRADEVVQTGGTGLDLGVGGGLDIAARSIALSGAFVAPGGKISLRTSNVFEGDDPSLGNITLAQGAVLSTAGVWTNDTVNRGAAEPARVQLDGGSVELSAARSVVADAGSMLDVSAGAWRPVGRRQTQGAAGQLTLLAGADLSDATLSLGGMLQGFDFSSGGSLTLGVPQLTVTNGSAIGYTLAPGFFSANGFGNIAVRSLGDVTVAGGTELTPQLRNWVIGAGGSQRAGGAMDRSVVSAQLLDEALVDRKPVNLSFAATGLTGPTDAQPGSSIRVERGASIVLEEGGKLNLQAARDIAIGATGAGGGARTVLQALGGEIALRTTGKRGANSQDNAGQDSIGFVPEQAIWIGDSATLSVAGTAEIRSQAAARFNTPTPTFSGGSSNDTLQVGNVLGGGKITLDAARGYVVTESGSRMNLDGFATSVNLPGLIAPVQTARSAGTLSVASPEGFVLDGDVSARAPVGASGQALADGGQLRLELGRGGVSTITLAGNRPYPDNATSPRQIVVAEQDGVLTAGGRDVGYGDDLNQALGNGVGQAPVRVLDRSGFDAITLRAGDKVVFSESVALDKKLGIEIDAPTIEGVPGVRVALRGPRVAIGNPSFSRDGDALPADTSAAPDTSLDQSTRLTIEADVVEVVGNSGLKGFSTTELRTRGVGGGELRLSGYLAPSSPRGSLAFAGELDIVAGQVYATSYSRFDVTGLGSWMDAPIQSALSIARPIGAGRSDVPLSAFGDLRFAATDIVQTGVVRQPFGAISFNASGTLTLGADSITSVSGDGRVVPFGTTTNLSQWFSPAVSGEISRLPVDKRVSIQAGTLVTEPGASVSARGGGDLQASEFFPGVGGSTDYLASPGLYAVLPDYRASYAPRSEDTTIAAASQSGAQIEITMAGSGLAPGRYTLLPARYALLADSLPQGAFIVKLAPDQGNAVLSRAIRQDDGSTVVTGYLTQAGSGTVGQPGQRFVVEPAAVVRAKSETRLTRISDLFDDRAASLGSTPAAVPRDAGSVQIAVTGAATTRLQASIDLSATGARAGSLDVSAPRVALVSDLGQTPDGYLGVSASTLEDSKAGSVLLGGLRRAQAVESGGTAVYAVNNAGTLETVVLTSPGRPVVLEELILSASERLSIGDGVSLASSGSATQGARALSFSGDGAAVAVSADADLQLRRSGARLTSGSLEIGPNARLAGQQVQLDATGSVALDPSIALDTRSLGLSTRRIAVGASSGLADATVLQGQLLTTVLDVDSLGLRSYSSIDFVGKQNFAQRSPSGQASRVLGSLLLDAPTVRGVDLLGGDGSLLATARTDIAAREVTLRNTARTVNPLSGAVSAAQPEAGLSAQGALLIEALPAVQYGRTGGIAIGPGSQQLGYAAAELRTTGDIVLQGTGSVRTPGDLTLTSSRVTAASGAVQSVVADGDLTVSRVAGGRTLSERVGQGARVTLAGRTIIQDGTLDLPSGTLVMQAAGTAADAAAISFGAGSVTSASGFSLQAQDGWSVHGNGGRIAVTAALGRIDAFGTIDVSAAPGGPGQAGQGHAGSISLTAVGEGGQVDFETQTTGGGAPSTVRGRLLGTGGVNPGDLGGQFSLDVQTVDRAGSGASTLATTASLVNAGGFDRQVDVRVRSGDLLVDGGLTAERIAITVDQGSLDVAAVALDARTAAGGVVQLQAGQDVRLQDGASIQAASSRVGANGGDVLLSSVAGRIQVAPTVTIDATGDDSMDGRIVLRAARGSDNASVNVDPLIAANLRAAEVDVEAVRVYRSVTAGGVTRDIASIAAGTSGLSGAGASQTGRLGQATLQADSEDFMTASSGVLDGLGIAAEDRDRVRLRAGVEVQASGNLVVANDWTLNEDRPGGDAGFLTLRAAGSLTVSGSISDGFESTAPDAALNDNRQSWSYRLAAGADLASADLLATRDLSAGTVETGNLSIAAGRAVRTGAGSIEMTAGRDIVFGGSGSSAPGQVYVAGRKASDQDAVIASLFASQPAPPTFTEQGGRLELQAERDIRAPAATQLINNWLWRSGLTDPLAPESYFPESQLAWWTEFSRFQQTAGSFGGGSVRARAGRDITNLAVMAPTSAYADSSVVAQSQLVVRNGGDVDVAAGGNVTDGQYFVGRGVGRLAAEGAINSTAPNSGRAVTLALMDGQWDVSAVGNVRIGAVVNPTAAPVPTADERPESSGYFFSYGAGSAVDVSSLAGNATLLGLGSGTFGTFRLDQIPGGSRLLQTMPESMRMSALGGSVEIASGVSALLAPSVSGQLEMFAAGDFNLGTNSTLGMVDSDDSAWRSFRNPIGTQDLQQLIEALGSVASVQGRDSSGGRLIADSQTHGDLRAGDSVPVRVAAGASISAGLNGALNLAKQARITAGQDINSLTLLGQHHRIEDFTEVTAGGNILHTDRGGYSLAGPGRLEVMAGRQIDLGSSLGLSTTGNQTNATLPRQGASVTVSAGTAGTVDLPVFDRSYLQPASGSGTGSVRWEANRNELRDFVRAALNDPALSYEQAFAYYQTFPRQAQEDLARRVLAEEFGSRYLTGTSPSTAVMTASIQASFEKYRAGILASGQRALQTGESLTLPGNEVLAGDSLRRYLGELSALQFSSIDVSGAVSQRTADLARHAQGWRQTVASAQGLSPSELEAIGAKNPSDPRFARYQRELTTFSGPGFERYQASVFAAEAASAGAAASNYGLRTLPVRLAFYDQGFAAAELAGAGNFGPTDYWSGVPSSLGFFGTLNMTQSSVITRRGGDISLLNPGGPINVGLKDSDRPGNAVTGVIALGGGDVFGFAKDDFQVNNQRVFIVGTGDMNIWSSSGDIDSGRGANTAVGTPPLVARRSVDGVVFEVPPTTTGSGLAILSDASGVQSGTIGLYPAFGEILALDAFIRAPSVRLGSTIKGADNIQSPAVSGAAAPTVSAPAVSTPPPNTTQSAATSGDASGAGQQESRQRNGLLTVELLGLGSENAADDECSLAEEERKNARRKDGTSCTR